MNKITLNVLVAVIAVQFVLLAHAVVTIEKMDEKIHEYEDWFDNTEVKIEELKSTALEMKNICEMYLNPEKFSPDNGNDNSQ